MSTSSPSNPGGSEGFFLHDGIKTNGGVPIVLDAKGNDSQFMRQSCKPNAIWKHVVGSNARLAVSVERIEEDEKK
ncbi:hypothetical protein CAEBREN_16797 [Caenorhabditis brenneri]|uniref:Uncharacterized protein n=1 Tax=Caenorhabditis brenneri TaxID=135651 RepID=G0PF99_CAEBE|nr:hypothetical protein CAEBREN_16797 [Caenorhabditis brenneri]